MSDKTLIRLIPSVLLLSGLAALHPAAAQFVTFGPAQTISSASDVSTTGGAVAAYNFDNGAATTVNGVTFSPASNTGSGSLSISGANGQYGGFGSGSPAFSSLSGSYQSLLTNAAYADSGTVGITQSGLTAGERYQVQYFVNDSRGGFGGRTVNVSSSGGNTQNLQFNSDNSAGSVGQYANGTFTAASGSVTITAAGVGGSPSQVNGLQYRDLGSAGAAITFGAATPIGTADAALGGLTGTIITAAAFGADTQTVTLTGGQKIIFDSASANATVVGGNGTTTGAFTGDTGNANFNTVLNGFNYDSAAGSKQITLSGLTAGQQYSLQLFGLDDRGGSNNRQYTFSGFSGNSTTVTSGANDYVLGTFTAASSFETLTESGTDGININALVLRDLSGASAAPEPSQIASLAFAALGMLGVVLKARKRKTSVELN